MVISHFCGVFAGRQYRPTKNAWFLRDCHVCQVCQLRRFVFVGILEECVSELTARRRFAWSDCMAQGWVAPWFPVAPPAAPGSAGGSVTMPVGVVLRCATPRRSRGLNSLQRSVRDLGRAAERRSVRDHAERGHERTRGEFSKNGDRAGTPDHPEPSRSRGQFLQASGKIFRRPFLDGSAFCRVRCSHPPRPAGSGSRAGRRLIGWQRERWKRPDRNSSGDGKGGCGSTHPTRLRACAAQPREA
jgi:hypothetical protein